MKEYRRIQEEPKKRKLGRYKTVEEKGGKRGRLTLRKTVKSKKRLKAYWVLSGMIEMKMVLHGPVDLTKRLKLTAILCRGPGFAKRISIPVD